MADQSPHVQTCSSAREKASSADFCGDDVGARVLYGTGLIAVERANGVSEGLNLGGVG